MSRWYVDRYMYVSNSLDLSTFIPNRISQHQKWYVFIFLSISSFFHSSWPTLHVVLWWGGAREGTTPPAPRRPIPWTPRGSCNQGSLARSLQSAVNPPDLWSLAHTAPHAVCAKTNYAIAVLSRATNTTQKTCGADLNVNETTKNKIDVSIVLSLRLQRTVWVALISNNN